tara:strand:- start:17334 stop:18143 length:810 start_codon:yes stop_codon:yes gene_type:complete
MNTLKTGEFYGTHYQKSTFENIIITDTEYTHSKVDWHYHEHPYFTYLLQGKLFESNKKEAYYLRPGSLLFHNWQDAHYNIKPPEYTRGFHIELNARWFMEYDIHIPDLEGSMDLKNPVTKSLLNKVFIESKLNDPISFLSIEALLIEIFGTIGTEAHTKKANRPLWTNRLREFLMEGEGDLSLKNLSAVLGIHPVHLSREFNRYFGTSLGNYIRLIRLNKAFCLMAANKSSMTEICYQCGFYDQSHFISNFKLVYGTTPSKILKNLQGC